MSGTVFVYLPTINRKSSPRLFNRSSCAIMSPAVLIYPPPATTFRRGTHLLCAVPLVALFLLFTWISFCSSVWWSTRGVWVAGHLHQGLGRGVRRLQARPYGPSGEENVPLEPCFDDNNLVNSDHYLLISRAWPLGWSCETTSWSPAMPIPPSRSGISSLDSAFRPCQVGL